MALPLQQYSALNLSLQGSTGSFRVGAAGGQNSSLEVKYLLTHISLNFETGASAQVLSHLAPVRELFETEQLEFDEIMQRDIDDARVSSELIPYLLDSRSRDLVKLFPPIVVVVLPTEKQENRPAARYPSVAIEKITGPQGHDELHTRAGTIGSEVFEFVQPIVDGQVYNHDANLLKINTARTRLVIVDGQHRAMSLLALYRNLKQDWANERRAPFKAYYEEWTPAYIGKYKIDEITLPVMFCTFPQIDEGYQGDYDLKKAARAVFLTLNKNARKVSESRNRLLDDNDVIAVFLRSTLSAIKRRDLRSQGSLRIHNVELDQAGDRIKVENPLAVTGVNHIYYIIEQLLLSLKDDLNGINARKGQYSKRVDLWAFGLFKRLDAPDLIGKEAADATNRKYFSRDVSKNLCDSYEKRYGTYLLEFFIRFAPFEHHARASLALEQNLLTQDNSKLRPILFEGQGMMRVFNSHLENVKQKKDNKEFGDHATKLQEILNNLNATAARIRESVERFKQWRAENFLDSLADKSKLKHEGSYGPKLVSFVSELYDNVFSSVAFQTAAIAGFFGVVEAAQEEASEGMRIDVQVEFNKYLNDIHKLFVPQSVAQLRKFVEVFKGQLEGDIRDWAVTETQHTFREVVFPGEMQPDQWPRYRYLMLELWRPENAAVGEVVSVERDQARAQVFANLETRRRADFLRQQTKREEDLTDQERKQIADNAYKSMRTLLGNLGWSASEIPSRTSLTSVGRSRGARGMSRGSDGVDVSQEPEMTSDEQD